jgi:uncharacterized membrane protein
LISVLFGIAVAAALMGTDWRIPTRLLAGWDCGVVLYLMLAYWMILMSGVPEIRRRAAADDEGAVALLFLTGFAALAALGAIIAELGGAKNANGSEADFLRHGHHRAVLDLRPHHLRAALRP